MTVKVNADTLWETDDLWLTLHSLFASTITLTPINLSECQWVILVLMASAALGKQSAKKNIILLYSTLHNPAIDI